MTLQRQLSDQLIDLLTPLLSPIVDDRELQVEIRKDSITIYHRGAAIIRDLHIDNGQLAGSVHFKYVPIRRPDRSDYFRVVGDTGGLGFESCPEPMAFDKFSVEILREYKRMIKSVSRNPESGIVHGIVSRSDNQVVDQELEFKDSGSPETDKIDICHFDTRLNCLALVEVKGLHDPRIRPQQGKVPEVVDQIRRYRTRIAQNHDSIVRACESSISLKYRLGLSSRLHAIPDPRPLSLLQKPVLVIGGCSRDDVRSILVGEADWSVLLDELIEHAAALILCGSNGCSLSIRSGAGYIRVFDAATR